MYICCKIELLTIKRCKIMVKHIYAKLVSLILLMLPLQLIAQTNISGNMPLQERQLTGIEKLKAKIGDPKVNDLGIPQPMKVMKKSPIHQMPDRLRRKPVLPEKTMMKAGARPLTLWGSLVYADSWDDIYDEGGTVPYGFYSFKASQSINPSILSDVDGYLYINGGGTVYDNTFHGVSYETSAWFGTTVYYVAYDTKTWEQKTIETLEDMSLVSTAVTHDPVSGKNYAICYDFNDQGQAVSRKLSTIDYESLTRKDIGALQNSYLAMACSPQGELFAIKNDGGLYRIDKAKATETLVGPTGVTPTTNLQSAAFDPKSGKMYWAAMVSSSGFSYSELIEVNTETGTGTTVGSFADNEEFTALHIPEPEAEDGAPARINDLNLIFAAEATTGKAVFTLPKRTFAGDKLTGELDYTLLVNGTQMATGKGEAATPMSVDLTVDPGMTTVTVYTTNSVGKSPEAQVKAYIGPDTPQPPTDVKLAYDETLQKATLTWTAPTLGENAGQLKPENISYKVVTYPDMNEVADKVKETSLTVDLPSDQPLAAYKYAVFAYNGDIKGKGRVSNKVVVGRPMEAPYSQDFSTTQKFDICEVVNVNADANTWKKEGKYAKYVYNFYNKADDWLLTPPVKLKGGQDYTFSITAKKGIDKYREKIMLGYGESTDVTTFKSMSDSIHITSMEDSLITRTVKIEHDGVYRFGVHAVSDANMFCIYIGSIGIDQVMDETAPEAVTDLAVKAANEGELKASISFKCPTKRVNGQALAAIKKAVVKRDGTLIATIDDPAPGSTQSVEDKTCVNGTNTYVVTVFDENGYGKLAEASAFVGEDVPDKPTDFKIADEITKVTGSWKAPLAGANGEYMNPDKLTYNIYTVNDGYLRYYLKGLTSTSVTFDDVDPSAGDPSLLYYYIGAISAGGESTPVPSNLMVKGAPVAMPFMESFPNAGLEAVYLWTERNGENGVSLASDLSADQDNGCLYFAPKAKGDYAWVNLPKISLAGATKPVLMFHYLCLPGYNMQIDAVVDKAPQAVNQLMQSVNFKTDKVNKGWQRMTIDLSQFKNEEYVVPKIKLTSSELEMPLVLDAIKVIDQKDYDLTAKLIAPESVTAGTDNTVNVFVDNIGANDAEKFTVNLYDGKTLVDSKSNLVLNAGMSGIVRFSWKANMASETTELKGEVVFDKDGNQADNIATKTITVEPIDGTPVNDLTAVAVEGEGVKLSWTAPEEIADGAPVTESFEKYDPFTYQALSPWTLYDGDKAQTYGFGGGATFPNNGQPFAYIVFNPTATDWDTEAQQADMLAPHTGKQYLASFSAYQKANDDWLISPELPGTAQTISFWVKTESSNYGMENYEVLYSSTDKDIKSFQRIGDVREAPQTQWTEVSVDLPEGAKYFAIRCVSNDKFMFMLDDITYIGVKNYDATPLAYNIYRDNKFVAKVDASKTSYTDIEQIPVAEHTYFVTVVYTHGESAASNKVTLMTAGINGMQIAGGLENADIKVYSVDGKFVAEGKGVFNILPAGKLYVIKDKATGNVVNIKK